MVEIEKKDSHEEKPRGEENDEEGEMYSNQQMVQMSQMDIRNFEYILSNAV
jgi:hypothetical protein